MITPQTFQPAEIILIGVIYIILAIWAVVFYYLHARSKRKYRLQSKTLANTRENLAWYSKIVDEKDKKLAGYLDQLRNLEKDMTAMENVHKGHVKLLNERLKAATDDNRRLAFSMAGENTAGTGDVVVADAAKYYRFLQGK